MSVSSIRNNRPDPFANNTIVLPPKQYIDPKDGTVKNGTVKTGVMA